MAAPRPRGVVSTACFALFVGLVLAGCGGGGDGGGDGGDGGGSGKTSLRMAIGEEPSSLDPLLVDDGQRDLFNWSVYEGLTTRTNEGEIVPALATEWKSDGSKWIFTLREGVTFHDGSPVRPEDVVASYERMTNPDLQSELVNAIIPATHEVTKSGPNEVTISAEAPDAILPARAALTAIMPESLAKTDNEGATAKMIGTGPYKFVAWNRGQSLDLEAYPEYWGEKPAIKTVQLRFLPDENARLAALQSGEVDVAAHMSPDLEGTAPQVVSHPQSEVHISQLNTYPGKPFEDERVRRAANLAIDRQALIDNIWGGRAELSKGQAVGQYVFGADPDMEDFSYDPEQARALLEEAGAVGAKVTMWTTTGRWPKDRDAADAQAEMLRKVGFDVKVEYPEFSEWLNPVFAAAEDDKNVPDMLIQNTSASLFDSSNALVANVACDGSHSVYCSKEIDRMMDQTDVELDEEKRAELFHEIWGKLHEDSVLLTVADVHGINFAAENLNWPTRNDVFMPIAEMSFD